MRSQFQSSQIIAFHDQKLGEPDWPARDEPVHAGPWYWIGHNHSHNTLLWDEEDRAQRTDASAESIAASKRQIDRCKQIRNDAVEAMDEALLAQLATPAAVPAEARLHSETAGAMIDRLSILSLKLFHMREQTRRIDVGAEHIARCRFWRSHLMLQRADLAACFDRLLDDITAGRAYFKVYRKFKMYSAPALPPYLAASAARPAQKAS